jgi:hypothetical protein
MSIRDDLKAYVDGELTPSREAEVRQALNADPALQAEVFELRQLSQAIRVSSTQPEPAGLESTLLALQNARRRDVRPRFPSHRLAWGLGLAATLVLAVLVAPHVGRSTEEDSAAAPASADKAESVAGSPETNGTFSAKRSTPPALDVPSGKKLTGGMAARGQGGVKHNLGGESGSVTAGVPMEEQRGATSLSKAGPVDGDYQAQPSLEVRNAELFLEVVDVSAAQDKATAAVKSLGGRIDSTGVLSYDAGLAKADMSLRVPARQFEPSVARLRGLGRVLNEGTSTEDVTARVADAEARLRVLRAEEVQDISLMRKAKTMADTLRVKDRLSEVRQKIESLDAQRKVLRNKAAMSTINLHLSQRPKAHALLQRPGWLATVWTQASDGLGSAGRTLGGAGVYLFVFAPLWAPVAGVGWWLYRKQTAR